MRPRRALLLLASCVATTPLLSGCIPFVGMPLLPQPTASAPAPQTSAASPGSATPSPILTLGPPTVPGLHAPTMEEAQQIVDDQDAAALTAMRSRKPADQRKAWAGQVLAFSSEMARAATAYEKRFHKKKAKVSAWSTQVIEVYGWVVDGDRQDLMLGLAQNTIGARPYVTNLVKQGSGPWRVASAVAMRSLPRALAEPQRIDVAKRSTVQALLNYRAKGTKPKATLAKGFITYHPPLTLRSSFASHYAVSRRCTISSAAGQPGAWTVPVTGGTLTSIDALCVSKSRAVRSNYWIVPSKNPMSQSYGYYQRRLRQLDTTEAFPTAVVTKAGKQTWHCVTWFWTSKPVWKLR